MAGVRWTDEDIMALCRMVNTGVPYEDIAKKIGRTVSACQTMMHNCRCRVDPLSNKIKK